MKKKIESIYKSAEIWRLIGRVVPLLFIGVLFLLYVIGFDDHGGQAMPLLFFESESNIPIAINMTHAMTPKLAWVLVIF